jgi:hypothetical protein
VTEQPPSQQPAEEPGHDKPAALVPDDAPTQVSSVEPVAAAASDPSAAPDPPAGPDPPAAFAPAGAPAGPPPASAPPRPVADLPSGDDASAEPGGLAAVFGPDHPERAVGAAFAGGIVLALILKRLAR